MRDYCASWSSSHLQYLCFVLWHGRCSTGCPSIQQCTAEIASHFLLPSILAEIVNLVNNLANDTSVKAFEKRRWVVFARYKIIDAFDHILKLELQLQTIIESLGFFLLSLYIFHFNVFLCFLNFVAVLHLETYLCHSLWSRTSATLPAPQGASF